MSSDLIKFPSIQPHTQDVVEALRGCPGNAALVPIVQAPGSYLVRVPQPVDSGHSVRDASPGLGRGASWRDRFSEASREVQIDEETKTMAGVRAQAATMSLYTDLDSQQRKELDVPSCVEAEEEHPADMLRSPALDMLASVDMDTDSDAEELEKKRFFNDDAAALSAARSSVRPLAQQQQPKFDERSNAAGALGATAAGEVYSESTGTFSSTTMASALETTAASDIEDASDADSSFYMDDMHPHGEFGRISPGFGRASPFCRAGSPGFPAGSPVYKYVDAERASAPSAGKDEAEGAAGHSATKGEAEHLGQQSANRSIQQLINQQSSWSGAADVPAQLNPPMAVIQAASEGAADVMCGVPYPDVAAVSTNESFDAEKPTAVIFTAAPPARGRLGGPEVRIASSSQHNDESFNSLTPDCARSGHSSSMNHSAADWEDLHGSFALAAVEVGVAEAEDSGTSDELILQTCEPSMSAAHSEQAQRSLDQSTKQMDQMFELYRQPAQSSHRASALSISDMEQSQSSSASFRLEKPLEGSLAAAVLQLSAQSEQEEFNFTFESSAQSLQTSSADRRSVQQPVPAHQAAGGSARDVSAEQRLHDATDNQTVVKSDEQSTPLADLPGKGHLLERSSATSDVSDISDPGHHPMSILHGSGRERMLEQIRLETEPDTQRLASSPSDDLLKFSIEHSQEPDWQRALEDRASGLTGVLNAASSFLSDQNSSTHSSERSESFLDQIDINNDGVIDRAEFQAHLENQHTLGLSDGQGSPAREAAESDPLSAELNMQMQGEEPDTQPLMLPDSMVDSLTDCEQYEGASFTHTPEASRESTSKAATNSVRSYQSDSDTEQSFLGSHNVGCAQSDGISEPGAASNSTNFIQMSPAQMSSVETPSISPVGTPPSTPPQSAADAMLYTPPPQELLNPATPPQIGCTSSILGTPCVSPSTAVLWEQYKNLGDFVNQSFKNSANSAKLRSSKLGQTSPQSLFGQPRSPHSIHSGQVSPWSRRQASPWSCERSEGSVRKPLTESGMSPNHPIEQLRHETRPLKTPPTGSSLSQTAPASAMANALNSLKKKHGGTPKGMRSTASPVTPATQPTPLQPTHLCTSTLARTPAASASPPSSSVAEESPPQAYNPPHSDSLNRAVPNAVASPVPNAGASCAEWTPAPAPRSANSPTRIPRPHTPGFQQTPSPSRNLRDRVRDGTASALSPSDMRRFQSEVTMQEAIMLEYQSENKRLMQQVKLLQDAAVVSPSAVPQPVEQSPINVKDNHEAQRQYHEFQLAANAREEVYKQEAAALRQQLDAQEHRHSTEINEARSKLEWFRQNQQLITKNEEQLRDQTNLISMLKKKLAVAADNAVVSYNNKKGNGSSRAADMKRIKELESKCKGLEATVLKKNPKSAVALLVAARTSEQEAKLVESLQEKLQQAKEQLESSNNSHDCAMRSLRQQYERVKGEYERRLELIQEQAHGSEGTALISRLQGNLKDITVTHEQQLQTSWELSNSLSDRVKELEQQVAAGGSPDSDAALREHLVQAQSHTQYLRQQQGQQQQLANQQQTVSCEAALRRETDADRERYRTAVAKAEVEVEQVKAQLSAAKQHHREEVSSVEVAASERLQRASKEHNFELQRMAERHTVEIQHLTNTINLTKLANSLVPTSRHQPEPPAAPAKPAGAHMYKPDEALRVRKKMFSDGWDEDSGHALRHQTEDREVSELQSQIESMEMRHIQQENKLQRLQLANEATEISRLTQGQYEEILNNKNEEVRHFRHELSSLLREFNVLKANQ